MFISHKKQNSGINMKSSEGDKIIKTLLTLIPAVTGTTHDGQMEATNSPKKIYTAW